MYIQCVIVLIVVPSQVSFLNHSSPTNTSIEICWGEPVSSNGVLLYYLVVIREIGSSNLVSSMTIGPYEKKCLVHNSTGKC